MTKADRIIEELGVGARRAITLAAGTHQGARVLAPVGSEEMFELVEDGLVGEAGGLTMLGSIVAGRMRAKLEEEMLG